MKIKAVTKYIFDGKEYNSLKDIQDAVHNIIGNNVVDEITKVAPLQKYANYTEVLKVLCNSDVRNTLMKCYNITFEREAESFEFGTTVANILDL